MTNADPERVGRFSDEEEAAEPSSTTDGPAARGEDDARQGSPGQPHPVGESFPDEGVRYGEEGRPRSEADGGS